MFEILEHLRLLKFILLFFRVIPQAVCTRFGLAIGATLAP